MSTPSQNRRLTRSSIRRQVMDEPDDAACVSDDPQAARGVRIYDGLSSASDPETAGESEAETTVLQVRPRTDRGAGGRQSGDRPGISPQRRTTTHRDDDEASEKLAWRLAAHEAGLTVITPVTSADETSQDEAERCAETEYESALSVDEDQETVVDVDTRGAAASGNQIIYNPPTDEQIERNIDTYDVLRGAVQASNRPSRTCITEIPCNVPVKMSASRNPCSPVRASPRLVAGRDVEPLTDAQEQAAAVRLELERDAARREHSQRRRKSRHTQAAAAPPPVVHEPQQRRAAAAGDQRVRREKTPLRRQTALLPLREPEDDIDSGVASPRERYFSRESGLRMPLFDGGDWAGFMSQFEACINYYGWTEKTKAIRLYTSIVGEARKTLGAVGASNWSFAQLKRHMEVRYGKSKVFAQIQAELLQFARKPEQTLHMYHDELVAASRTANISERQREELVHTAFVFGLRNNQHMHRWVTRHEREPTIEAALAAAEEYEEEYGSDPVFQSLPVTVNARDTTGNALAVALVGAENTTTPHPSVSVNAVQTEDGGDLKQMMNQGFKQLSSNLQSKFDKLDTRLAGVEKWQADQIQYFKDRAAKQRAEREKRNKEWKDKKDKRNNGDHQKNSGGNQGGQAKEQEVNTRSSVPVDAE